MSPSKLTPEAEKGEEQLRQGVRELKERIDKSRQEQAELEPKPKKRKAGRPPGSRNKPRV
jgi:uncharacterized small protein (DUF1192 family)